MKLNYDHIKYLDNLQHMGEVNMFGSAPFLQAMFDLGRHESQAIVLEWMEHKTAQAKAMVKEMKQEA